MAVLPATRVVLSFGVGSASAAVAHRRLDQLHGRGVFLYLVLRAAVGVHSPALKPVPSPLSSGGRRAAGAESSFLAGGLGDLHPARFDCRNVHGVCFLAIDESWRGSIDRGLKWKLTITLH